MPGFSLHEELAHLVDAGLTPFEALRAGTTDAARFLGVESEVGAVREGLRADLLLLDGDPLQDVTNAARIAGVMLRGRWLSRTELGDLLRHAASQAAGS